MRKCQYCEETELCGVGQDNIPVCEKHFNDYLIGKRIELEFAIAIVQTVNKEQ